MTSRFARALSPPSWGCRLPLGGVALLALQALLWSLFLGTVGAGPAPAGVGGSLARAGAEAP
jgi:hypothetical protein